jgi:hypothetical protein
VGGHGEQRQHPDDEEMVWNQRVHFRQPYALDADPLEDLRVAVAIQQLSSDGRRLAAEFAKDDACGEGEGDAGCDDEG